MVESRAAEISNWWALYKANGDNLVKEHLIITYAPLVKYVVGRVSMGLPPYVDADDLYGYGVFGLLDALERFDPTRGIKFETYALPRIKGAIWDGVRSVDWIPRSVRQKARDLEKAFNQVEQRLGRTASDGEVAHALGMDEQEYGRLVAEISSLSVFSLDEALHGEGESQLKLSDAIIDPNAAHPDADMIAEEEQQELVQALQRLPERECLVLTLYYYEGLTLKEIGSVLEVSESRVCQLHTKAIVRLRSWLMEQPKEDVGRTGPNDRLDHSRARTGS